MVEGVEAALIRPVEPMNDRLAVAPNNQLDTFNGSRRLSQLRILFSFLPERNAAISLF